eukprot:1148447-Pelagomonas_calceolata.AAC.1
MNGEGSYGECLMRLVLPLADVLCMHKVFPPFGSRSKSKFVSPPSPWRRNPVVPCQRLCACKRVWSWDFQTLFWLHHFLSLTKQACAYVLPCAPLSHFQELERCNFSETHKMIHVQWHPRWEATEMLQMYPYPRAHVQAYEWESPEQTADPPTNETDLENFIQFNTHTHLNQGFEGPAGHGPPTIHDAHSEARSLVAVRVLCCHPCLGLPACAKPSSPSHPPGQ